MNKLTSFNENNISFEESLKLFRDFSVKSKDCDYLPPTNADNQDFGSDFPGGLIYRPKYENCRFHLSQFKASNGAFSFFRDCNFYDCHFENSNFNYCNFNNCKFICEDQFKIESTGLNYSQLKKVEFRGVNFAGISFRDMQLQECIFEGCLMSDSSFERTVIKDTLFKDIDFRNIGIRYCQFSNVKFKNIVFPILDLANNIGLAEIFEDNSNQVQFSLGYLKEVNYEEAKQLLLLLIPYYQETNQYFPILNTYLLNKQYDKVAPLLHAAVEYSIEQFDFDSLYNICKLISDTQKFTNIDLRKFYEALKSSINPEMVPYNIQKGYIHYMDEIKGILLSNPNGYPSATIELRTDILIDEPEKLIPIIRDTENVVSHINANISPIISVSHNSPCDIQITIFAVLPEILRICQIFYYSFGGLKALNDIKNSKHEKVDNSNQLSGKGEYSIEETNSTFFSFGPMKFSKETKKSVKTMEFFVT